MELTELDVDFLPRSPADGRRKEECGVTVPGLRLDLFRCVLLRLSAVLFVLILGLAGKVARV